MQQLDFSGTTPTMNSTEEEDGRAVFVWFALW